MSTSSIPTATAVIRADKSLARLRKRKRLPGIVGAPFSHVRRRWKSLARFCSRLLLRYRLSHGLLWRRLLLRDVFFLHFALLPVQEKSWIGIVGSQRARKVDSAVLYHARRFGLAHDLRV